MYLRVFIFLFFSLECLGLVPGKMPNGESKRFYPNKSSPREDLKSLQPKEAQLILKHWSNNIAVQPEINKEDYHILKRINELNNFINLNTDPHYVYLIWCPSGVLQEVLFMVLVYSVHTPRTLLVSILIPSPFWDSSQIESIELKRSLEDLADRANMELELDYLYEKDTRFELAWQFWK